MLQVEGLEVSYGPVQVLWGVDLRVEAQENLYSQPRVPPDQVSEQGLLGVRGQLGPWFLVHPKD